MARNTRQDEFERRRGHEAESAVVEESAPEQVATHIAARARSTRFRRGGIEWTPRWQAYAKEDLGGEKLAQVLHEGRQGGMLDVREGSADDMRRLAELDAPDGAVAHELSQTSKAELYQALQRAERRADRAERALAELKVKIASGDLPPNKAGDLPAGTFPPSGGFGAPTS